jgi:ABC-type ATPase involved in cell division
VTDNVALLPMLAGKPNAQARKEARDLLEVLDVEHRAAAMPSQLSGGEPARRHRPRTGEPPAGDPGGRANRAARQRARWL